MPLRRFRQRLVPFARGRLNTRLFKIPARFSLSLSFSHPTYRVCYHLNLKSCFIETTIIRMTRKAKIYISIHYNCGEMKDELFRVMSIFFYYNREQLSLTNFNIAIKLISILLVSSVRGKTVLSHRFPLLWSSCHSLPLFLMSPANMLEKACK